MCSCCHSCCYDCCFPPRCREKNLVVIGKPRICISRKKKKCNCHRNRCLLEAMAYLFHCTYLSMLSTLWQVAYKHGQPLKGFPRDAAWSVMQRVTTPLSEMHDLEIYDSLYDRCGKAIDPFDPNNNKKMLRLMFLSASLGADQRMSLILMLEQLNKCALQQVDVDLLLKTLASIDIKQFVYSLIHQDNQSVHNAKLSEDLSQLYERVGTTDKNIIIRNRNRLAKGEIDMDMDIEMKQSQTSTKTLLYCIPRSADTEFKQSRLDPSGCLRYA